ncbi:MAG: PAS domain S-box protein [Anaerolineales bacterium]|nr:MAG: PAS domain S-box protein [Anaerolineales bacterium]
MKAKREKKPFSEPSLEASELRYRRLFEAAQDGILILDAGTGMIEDVNPYLIKMLGYSREEFVKKKLWEVGAFKDIKASEEAFEELQEKEYIRYEDLPLKAKDGRLVQVEFISNVYWVGDEKVIQCNIRDNAEHKRIIAALQANEKKYYDLLNQSPDGYFIIELSGRILTVNEAMCKELEFSEEEFLSMNIWEIIPDHFLDQYRERLTKILAGESLKEAVEYEVGGKDGKVVYVEVLSAPRYSGKDIIGFQGIARDISPRKRAEAALRQSETKFRSLIAHLPTVVYMNPVDDASTTLYVSPQIENLLGYTPEEWLADPKLWSKTIHPEDHPDVLKQAAYTDQRREPFNMDYRMTARDGSLVWVHDQLSLVNDLEGKPQYWQGIMLDITERKQTENKIRRQIDYLTALQDSDRTIASAFDMHLSLNALIAKARSLLAVDAAAVLLIDYSRNAFEFAAGSGFQTNTARGSMVRADETHAGRVALEHQIVKIPDPKSEAEVAFMTGYLKGEDFTGYYGVPLVIKGRVIGVFEVFQRSLIKRDQEWLDFLNALAGQAAIAISNAQLFESLQQSNSELAQAYNATIEGWSRALDLRDKETEGHSLRVTEMTVELARTFGLSDAELVQVRWGSLLHDIGKMGVPDGILLKPSALTEEEWAAMKKHPTFAFEMLAPIHYLRLALDIPYCHHEKWDGSGYPRGLTGEQIPLTARIFAVVDVWDALISDRPYRLAWTEEKALEYIRTSAGAHFDPQVVVAFMQLNERRSMTA